MADSKSVAQHADIVQEAFAGFGAEDPGAIADAFHPAGELILTGGLAGLTGDRHAGRDAVRAWFVDWFETMQLTAAEVENLAPVGDRMLMVANQRSQSQSVGAPAATRFAVICSFRDGQISRFELFQDPDEARHNLGLDRWPWDEHTVDIEPFDSPEALELRAELEADLAHRYGGDTEPGVKPTEETVLAFLVARDGDGAPVGCGALLELGDTQGGIGGAAEIKRMFVRPGQRGRGLSRRLLEALEREALRRGFDRVRLETGERQPEAMGLYRSAGYEEIEKYGPYRDAPLSRCFERRLR
jgi:GNAT superfamily N-acetyltransferase/ketosteroid isomerase-like protein